MFDRFRKFLNEDFYTQHNNMDGTVLNQLIKLSKLQINLLYYSKIK